MTSDHDQPPASGGPPTPRLRPRTLDLPAEQAAPEPIRTTTGDEAMAAGAADTGAPHQDAAADVPSSDTVSGDAPPALPVDEPPDDAPRRRGWLPAVSMVGAGVLGAAIVLAVLGSMGLLVNPNDGLSAVDARLAGLEL